MLRPVRIKPDHLDTRGCDERPHVFLVNPASRLPAHQQRIENMNHGNRRLLPLLHPRHVEYIGVDEAGGALWEDDLPLGCIILHRPLFHIKQFDFLMPMPRRLLPQMLLQFHIGSDIREIRRKIRQLLFIASRL